MQPRVLLADDHPAVLKKVATLLSSTCDIVGEVGDGKALIEAEGSLHPDVLIMDISMPIMSGIEAAQHLKRSETKTKIIVLTVHEDPDFLGAALAAGASAYVIKSRLATDLIAAVNAVLKGRRFISPSLSTEDTYPPH
jgi:DNA-binding NarL/FixJ family response regulator